MHIRTIHNGQDVKLVGAHPFECQVKALIGVDVRKIESTYKCPQLSIGILRQLTLQREAVDNPDYAAAIHHEPTFEIRSIGLAAMLPEPSVPLAATPLRARMTASYLTLTMSLARLCLREVYAILYCQGFVDGLPLKP